MVRNLCNAMLQLDLDPWRGLSAIVHLMMPNTALGGAHAQAGTSTSIVRWVAKVSHYGGQKRPALATPRLSLVPCARELEY